MSPQSDYPLHLLIVEDQPETTDTLCLLIETMYPKAEIRTADNILQAKQLLEEVGIEKRRSFDVAILDYQLPADERNGAVINADDLPRLLPNLQGKVTHIIQFTSYAENFSTEFKRCRDELASQEVTFEVISKFKHGSELGPTVLMRSW